MRNSRPVLALVLGFLLGSQAFAQTGGGVNWKPFDKGLKDAADHKKYSFVDVYTDWCGYCKMLDKTTLRAKNVMAELDKNFVSIKLNAESQDPITWKGQKMTGSQLASALGVSGFPTLLFLNSKGEVIGSYPSFAEAELMIKLLTYISSGARERKVSFEDYLKEAS